MKERKRFNTVRSPAGVSPQPDDEHSGLPNVNNGCEQSPGFTSSSRGRGNKPHPRQEEKGSQNCPIE